MIETTRKILVWDWTVRLFHWGTVLLVPALWWTAEQGVMDWHRRIGLTLLGLLAYRIYWGVVGTSPARFSSFIRGPGAILAYLKGLGKGPYHATAGHNPVGGLSVLAMLLALAAQIGFGLFSVDVDGLESGPLARLVDFETGRQFAHLHEFTFNILLALIALHVAAIIAYKVALKTNLVTPMVTGRRTAPAGDQLQIADARASLIRIAIGVAFAAAVVWAVAK